MTSDNKGLVLRLSKTVNGAKNETELHGRIF